MNAPSIGELKTRMTFQQPVSESDNAGGQVITWQPYAARWGAVQQVRGSENDNDNVTRGQVTMQVVVRTDPNINATMRCVIGNAAYTILSVTPLNDTPQWMICMLERKEGL